MNRFPEPPINHLSLFSWSGSGESPASLSPPLATRERPSTLMERLLWELSPRIKKEIVLAPLARSQRTEYPRHHGTRPSSRGILLRDSLIHPFPNYTFAPSNTVSIHPTGTDAGFLYPLLRSQNRLLETESPRNTIISARTRCYEVYSSRSVLPLEAARHYQRSEPPVSSEIRTRPRTV